MRKIICPADRGDPPFEAIVLDVGTAVQDRGFVWVYVQNTRTGNKSIWPSNRLPL